MVETIQVGQTVPNFKMKAYNPSAGDFAEITLEGFQKQKKWTVLFFYPADFTFVCATEFEALAEKHNEFQQMGVEVVTVSKDTQYTHLAWHQHEKELAAAKFLMGSDPTATVAKMFGVYDEGSGLALRGTFVISPEGKLTNSEVNFYNVGRNVDELVRRLKANIYLSKAPAEVCPAKWKSEGDKTLKPSAKMVGKVHEALKG